MRKEMIHSKFQELRRLKAYKENRDLTIRTIAEETGLAIGTVHRLTTGKIEGVRVGTLDTLCQYFGVASISELIEYEPNADK